MIRSFRLRLALMSGLLTGLVLLAFGASAYWVIHDLRLNKLLQEAREHAEREARRSRAPEEWPKIETRIGQSLGVGDDIHLALHVAPPTGPAAYASTRWPAALSLSTLPWPAAPETLASREPRPQSLSIRQSITGQNWVLGIAVMPERRVALAVDTAFIDSEMAGIRNGFLLALPLALLLTGAGAYGFSGRAIHPLQKLLEAATKISAQHLDQRIVNQDEDQEFAQLINAFNTMLERLERNFHQALRFSADASHELKTPLAILQGQLEQLIAMQPDGSNTQVQLVAALDQVRRISTLSRKLLLLSQADAGKLSLHYQTLDLSALLHDLVDDLQLLAPHLLVRHQIAPGLSIAADPGLLPLVLNNMASNAVKYNLDNGWIHLEARAEAEGVRVFLSNASENLDPQAQSRLFERFFRAHRNSAPGIEGTGLGLSVAREIARAHGGELSFRQEEDNCVCFTLWLPWNLA